MGTILRKRIHTKVCHSVMLTLYELPVACARRPPKGADNVIKFSPQVEQDYKIGADDRVEVSVWRNPDLSVTVHVRPDGQISVPLIGDIPVGGFTVEEVATRVCQKLSLHMREANVVVIVTEFRSREFLSRVRVTGAVKTPRSLNYWQGMTALDAVREAGGIDGFASPNRTQLFRTSSMDDGTSKTKIYNVFLGDILTMGKAETNFRLLPGDVITVPERFI